MIIFGFWQVDLSDIQWRDFRLNLPLLSLVAVVFIALSHVIRRVAPDLRVVYYCVVSAGFLVYLNGVYAVVVVALTMPAFVMAKVLGDAKVVPVLTWVRT